MFVVKLYSRKIFSYVFFVRKYFHNEIKANYGSLWEIEITGEYPNVSITTLTKQSLTTDDECTCHATLVACYQLAQSVLKIGSTLAERVGQGEVGGFQHGMLCTWQLPWLAVWVGTSLGISLLFDTIRCR